VKAIAFAMAGAVVLSTLAGCGQLRSRPANNEVMSGNKIVFSDKRAEGHLGLVRELPSTRPNGLLAIAVVLCNNKNNDLRCEVKVEFVDDKGAETDATSWRPYDFPARTELTITADSKVPSATDYRLCIRSR